MTDLPGPRPPYEVDELARLVVLDSSLESVLTALTEVGKRLLPSAAEVSVTLVRAGVAETVASTGRLAEVMDEGQYAGGAGPCLTAAREGRVVAVPDLAGAGQWPELAERAQQQGVGSSLSIPVKLPDPLCSSLNLYGRRPHAFAEHEQELACALAAYATVAMANLHLYESQKRVAGHLEKALGSRGIIDQAKGIVMARERCTADEAFQHLVVASQRTNRELREVAEELVNRTAGA